jgi:hypothetical protein
MGRTIKDSYRLELELVAKGASPIRFTELSYLLEQFDEDFNWNMPGLIDDLIISLNRLIALDFTVDTASNKLFNRLAKQLDELKHEKFEEAEKCK